MWLLNVACFEVASSKDIQLLKQNASYLLADRHLRPSLERLGIVIPC